MSTQDGETTKTSSHRSASLQAIVAQELNAATQRREGDVQPKDVELGSATYTKMLGKRF